MTILSINEKNEIPEQFPIGLTKLMWNIEDDIPYPIPETVVVLIANKITVSPATLPEGLKYLELNNVEKLPRRIPSKLNKLFCNSVREIHYVPYSLVELHCNNVVKPIPGLEVLVLYLTRLSVNSLTRLPDNLGKCVKLKTLKCDSVRNLPEELPPFLTTLSCNKAVALPKLPVTLLNLYCDSIKVIDELPVSLSKLSCDSVEVLPKLPADLYLLSANSVISVTEEQLPDRIEILKLNRVPTLPENLPKNLKVLRCNSVKKLSRLSDKILSIKSTSLETMVNVPESLETLVTPKLQLDDLDVPISVTKLITADYVLEEETYDLEYELKQLFNPD